LHVWNTNLFYPETKISLIDTLSVSITTYSETYLFWYDLIERSFNERAIFCCMIDFYKYLACPACKDSGLYCIVHRKEVEQILAEKDNS